MCVFPGASWWGVKSPCSVTLMLLCLWYVDTPCLSSASGSVLVLFRYYINVVVLGWVVIQSLSGQSAAGCSQSVAWREVTPWARNGGSASVKAPPTHRRPPFGWGAGNPAALPPHIKLKGPGRPSVEYCLHRRFGVVGRRPGKMLNVV